MRPNVRVFGRPGMRWLVVAAVATALVAVLALGSAGRTAAAADGMTWKISQHAWTSSSLSPAHATSAPAVKDPVNGFVWPTEDAHFSQISGAMVVQFDGSVTLGNFVQGNYRIVLDNPRLEVDTLGNGVVYADVSYCAPFACGGPMVGPFPGTRITTFFLPDDQVTDTGSHVEFTVTPEWASAGNQFDQEFLDIMVVPGLDGHFKATGSGSDVNKPPTPITVSFDYSISVGGTVSLAVSHGDPSGAGASTMAAGGLAALVIAGAGAVVVRRRFR